MQLSNKPDVADLDYSFDFANRLPAGDVFTTASFEVRTGDVTVHNLTCAGTVITFWLSGGTAGQRCEIMIKGCLLYTSPSPRDGATSRMPSSA